MSPRTTSLSIKYRRAGLNGCQSNAGGREEMAVRVSSSGFPVPNSKPLNVFGETSHVETIKRKPGF